MKAEPILRKEFSTATRLLHIARGALRWLRPHVLDAAVSNHMKTLTDSSEAFKRLLTNRAERERITRDVRTEIVTARQRAAAIALFALRSVEQHVGEWHSLLAVYRRDVTRSPAFERALEHVSPDGLIALATYRLQRQNRLANESAAQWQSAYLAARSRGDAAAMVDAELIEAMLPHAKPTNDEDRAILKTLREIVSWNDDERTPKDLPDFEELAADVRRLHERASVLQLTPVNPEHDPAAAAVYRQHEAELLRAGAASDRDDLQSVRQELGAAVNE